MAGLWATAGTVTAVGTLRATGRLWRHRAPPGSPDAAEVTGRRRAHRTPRGHRVAPGRRDRPGPGDPAWENVAQM